MSEPFNGESVAARGWRQGAVLGTKLATLAREHAPASVVLGQSDWLVVMSHDCDIVNDSLAKEPFVEVLRMCSIHTQKLDSRQSWGRNPRTLQLVIAGDESVILSCTVHDRWLIPREFLLQEPPLRRLPKKERRLVAEWIAKRYIRAAFPTAFDLRWRSTQKDWQDLLRKRSEWIQGVYLRLNTLDELPKEVPYLCQFLLAVPPSRKDATDVLRIRTELKGEVQSFWSQFKPSIECVDVEVLGTDEITLVDLAQYQRFDADWVSFEDDTSSVSPIVDMEP